MSTTEHSLLEQWASKGAGSFAARLAAFNDEALELIDTGLADDELDTQDVASLGIAIKAVQDRLKDTHAAVKARLWADIGKTGTTDFDNGLSVRFAPGAKSRRSVDYKTLAKFPEVYTAVVKETTANPNALPTMYLKEVSK